MGKTLRVDLSKGKIAESALDEELVERFVGGLGIGGKMLFDEVGPDVDAFDPDNRLIFCTGPVTGTIAPSAARYTVVTKSPATGFFGDASAGGNWGPELKFTGYDLIEFVGKSSKPVLLFIQDGKAELKDASHLWGLDARTTERSIIKDSGDRQMKVASIGQAGENLVRIAGIMNEDAGRTAARCGVGAVMGSKMLKAVAVRGHQKVPVANEDALRKMSREIIGLYRSDERSKSFHERGTPGFLSTIWEMGEVPAYNWGKGPDSILPIEKLALPGGYDEILSGTRACLACTLGCRRAVNVNEGPYATEDKVEGPEYEGQAVFGPNCGVSDIRAVAKANDLCNLYGLDIISAGSAIAFAMECYENGLITKEDTDGVELRFGNQDAMIEMVTKIAKREGFGNILAEGVKKASEKIGKGSERYAIHIKGLEVSMHDPRAFQAWAPHYATAITGGRHTEGLALHFELEPAPQLGIPSLPGRFSTEGKGYMAKVAQDWSQIYNSMGWCQFGEMFFAWSRKDNIVLGYNYVTGDEMTISDAMKAGERIFNLRKLFNMRHGATRADDTLPKRLLNQAKTVDKGIKMVAKLEETLPQYYQARAWDPETSRPTEQKLEELGLMNEAKKVGY